MTTPTDLSPPCSVCLRDDRMVHLEPTVVSDFGGVVDVFVCEHCGITAIRTSGVSLRPSGGDGNLSFVIKLRTDQ